MIFDKQLLDLTDNCVVIKTKNNENSSLMIDPEPKIKASDNEALAHEICHLLGGEEDYGIYNNALDKREGNKVFKYILNILFDWYHEYKYGKYSDILWKYLTEMHESGNTDKHFVGISAIDGIAELYLRRNVAPEYIGIDCSKDLVGYAEQIYENVIDDETVI